MSSERKMLRELRRELKTRLHYLTASLHRYVCVRERVCVYVCVNVRCCANRAAGPNPADTISPPRCTGVCVCVCVCVCVVYVCVCVCV